MECGINLGGAFDRRDGQPGWPVGPEVLDAIAAAGFTGVRLPVRWANARLAEVAEVVEAVVTRGLSVVVTNHHDDEAMEDGTARPVGWRSSGALSRPSSSAFAVSWPSSC